MAEQTKVDGKSEEDTRRARLKVVGLPDAHSQAMMKAQREEEELASKNVPEAQPGQPEEWSQRMDGHRASSWGNIICSQCNSKHTGSAAFSDHLNGKKHKHAMQQLEARNRQRVWEA